MNSDDGDEPQGKDAGSQDAKRMKADDMDVVASEAGVGESRHGRRDDDDEVDCAANGLSEASWEATQCVLATACSSRSSSLTYGQELGTLLENNCDVDPTDNDGITSLIPAKKVQGPREEGADLRERLRHLTARWPLCLPRSSDCGRELRKV